MKVQQNSNVEKGPQGIALGYVLMQAAFNVATARKISFSNIANEEKKFESD